MGGDKDGRDEFTAYFTARAGFVRRSAYLLCGDWHTADDLAQDAFVRLAVSWNKIRDHEAIDAFMRICLIRSYLREQKRAWRRNEKPVAELPDQTARVDVVAQHVHRIDVRAALGFVPPRQRAVLVCRYFWDLDVAETARVLDCSTGTVKSQTARALDRLRSLGLTYPTLDDGTP